MYYKRHYFVLDRTNKFENSSSTNRTRQPSIPTEKIKNSIRRCPDNGAEDHDSRPTETEVRIRRTNRITESPTDIS